MIIAIDLTSLSYHLTGIERYAMCVTDKLIENDQMNTYILIFRNEIATLYIDRIDGKRIQSIVLYGNNKFMFLQFTLAKALRNIRADKYIFFAFPSPILFRRKGIINTIHDMGAWDSSREMKSLSKYYFRISYKNAAKASEKIITVSNFTRNRIHLILGVPYEKIEVVHSAVYDGISEKKVASYNIIKREYNLPDKYIMTLSTLEPRKNMNVLLQAFDKISDKVNYDLVLVGRKGWKMDEVIARYNTKDRIHITGFVKDEHLSAIYRNAICFVFPSLYEGFGLPPVEALSLGTAVIASDASALPEVLQDRAVYFKSNSQEELEDILIDVEINEKDMKHSLNEYQKTHYNFDYASKKIIERVIEEKT